MVWFCLWTCCSHLQYIPLEAGPPLCALCRGNHADLVVEHPIANARKILPARGLNFIDYMIQKLSQHNSLNRQAYLLGIPNNVGTSLFNYIILLAPIIPLACTLTYFVVRNRGMKFVFTRNGLRFFGLAAWPIITLHCLLLSYSSQGFTPSIWRISYPF